MLQTSRFQVSRKKLQVISIALKFARFVVLGINSSKHNIHVICFCYKYWNSRHSQLLQMSNVSSWFPDLKKTRKKSYFINSWRWRHWWGYPVYDTDSGYRSTWFIRRLLLSLIGQLVWWVSLHTSRIRPKYQIWQNICANQRPCR